MSNETTQGIEPSQIRTSVRSINTDLLDIFKLTVQQMIDNNVTFVVPAFYPQRAGIARDIIAMGGKVVIAGGTPGQTLFEGAEQYSPYETTGISETPEGIKDIVDVIPEHLINGKNVALFVEAAVGTEWSNNLKRRGANVVLSNEQNLRSFFEEKSNLETILKTAGLEEHFIPSQVVVKESLSAHDIEELYHTYRNTENGKIVLQSCGAENFESGGGKGTSIASTLDEFQEMIAGHQGHIKIATFIEGLCSNMSMFVSNTIADKENGGVKKGMINDENPFDTETLKRLLEKGKALGISEDRIIVLPARATLKVIGDPHLTASESNGVGNSLGHDFPAHINAQVWQIAQKLGSLMAKCGKVGLCGTDLIIDNNGRIWINEVNDRQQGPTEQLSLDAEQARIPGIYRLAFIANYTNCANPKVQRMFYRLQKRAQSIFEGSLSIDGTFYIKMMGKESQISQIDLNSGLYKVVQDESGNWVWELSSPCTQEQAPRIDLKTGEIVVKLQCGLPKGQEIPKGTQILRIVGTAKSDSLPFVVNGNKGGLNSKWVPLLNALRHQIFHQRSNG